MLLDDLFPRRIPAYHASLLRLLAGSAAFGRLTQGFTQLASYYTSAFDDAAPGADVVAEMAAQHREILEALIGQHWARAREALALHIRAQRPVLAQLLHSEGD